MPPPAKFDPKGKTPVREWIFKMDIWFQASSIPNNIKVMQAATLLEGHAFTWWMAKNRDGDIPNNWIQFSTELIRQFDSVNASTKARRTIRNLKQTGSVSDYDNTFSTLAFQIVDMNEAEAFHQFKTGLKPFIQEKMDELNITTLPDLKEAAICYDDLKFYHRITSSRSEFKGPSTRKPERRGVHEIDKKNGKDAKDVTCFKCGKKGHYQKDCKAKKPPFKKENSKDNSSKLNLVTVKVKKLNPSATLPVYKTKAAAGADIKPCISGES